MERLNIFTVNELSQRTAELLEDAQHGHLVLITNKGSKE